MNEGINEYLISKCNRIIRLISLRYFQNFSQFQTLW